MFLQKCKEIKLEKIDKRINNYNGCVCLLKIQFDEN